MADTSAQPKAELSAGLGAASALSVVLIWAAWLVSTRHSVGTSLTALDLSLLRYGIPAALLAPYWLRTGLWPKNTPKLPLILMVVGSGAPFFQVVGFGMKATPASAAGVLLPGVMPLMTAIIGMLLLGERPTGCAGSAWPRSLRRSDSADPQSLDRRQSDLDQLCDPADRSDALGSLHPCLPAFGSVGL